ncbi:MAG: class I SAM-dependent methyltransferase [Caldilineales bacterium]
MIQPSCTFSHTGETHFFGEKLTVHTTQSAYCCADSTLFMNHDDHVRLLSSAVQPGAAIWADLGSGTGAFTLALADLLGPEGTIYSVDQDRGALTAQRKAMERRFPASRVHYLTADFTARLALPQLDGVVLANSLHFVSSKESVVRLVMSYLRPGGQIVLVEYNTDAGNRWVPCPLSFDTWRELAGRCGLMATRKLAAVPSRFLGEIYAAQSMAART